MEQQLQYAQFQHVVIYDKYWILKVKCLRPSDGVYIHVQYPVVSVKIKMQSFFFLIRLLLHFDLHKMIKKESQCFQTTRCFNVDNCTFELRETTWSMKLINGSIGAQHKEKLCHSFLEKCFRYFFLYKYITWILY